MGTWKSLRVQGFMIGPESIGVLKEIKLGCHDMVTKLNFLQYNYRIRINHKTLYSQTFPGHI